MAKAKKRKTVRKPAKRRPTAAKSRKPAPKPAAKAARGGVSAASPSTSVPRSGAKALSPAKAKTQKAAKPAAPAKPKVEGTPLGQVDDYFAHVGVIALKLEAPLSLGDMIRVKGHTTDITQKVESMQIEHMAVQTASKGDEVGIKVVDRARKRDSVYKV